MELNLDLLCKRDLDQPILVSVLDYEENGRHQAMGSFQTTVNGLLEAKVYFDEGEIDTSKAFIVMHAGEVYGKIVVAGARIENPERAEAAHVTSMASSDAEGDGAKGKKKKKRGKQKKQHQIKFNTHGDELSIGTIESSDEAKVQQMLEEPKNVFGDENNEDDGKSRPWKEALPQNIGLDGFTDDIGNFDDDDDDGNKEGSLTDIAALLARVSAHTCECFVFSHRALVELSFGPPLDHFVFRCLLP
jgi:hypothetical protein